MYRVLITGSEGFIGRHVCSLLKEEGFDVYTLDLVGSGNNHYLLDLSSVETNALISRIKPDVIIHLAAQVDVMESFSDPGRDLAVNGVGTLNLLLSASEAGTRKFIFVGSGGAIYDSNSKMPVDEGAKTNPVSPYGLSKLLAEGYVRILSKEFGIEWVSLALSNCYGDVQKHKRGVIYSFYKSLMNNQNPIINGEHVSRDFIHVDDVARAVLLSIKKTPNCRLNISSNTEVTLLDLYDEIASILGKSVTPIIRKYREGDVLRSRLDNTLAKNLIGWSPTIDLHTGLRKSLIGS